MSREGAAPAVTPATVGVVLAGGLARRMGGGDKARIRVGGRTILESVLSRLAPQCRRLVLNAAGDTERFADTGLAVVSDSVPDYAGPLAGILAGLDWASGAAPDVAWLVSAPSDCPFLPRDLVARLHHARAAADGQLACASSAGRRHPVAALWPIALCEELRRALTEEGVRKVEQWTARYGLAVAEWPATPVDPFFNVNTPEEVAEAERLATAYPQL
jgi:molybdenum cofactor guanylyltransferase